MNEINIKNINLYNILNIDLTANENEIIDAYNFKINQYNNLPFLTKSQKNDIKIIKSAKYILTNENLKYLYDKNLKNKQTDSEKLSIDNNKFYKSPTAIYDRLFNI